MNYPRKNVKIKLILIIFPLLLFFTSDLIKEAGGPYYLNYYDPGYVYLVNSLNLIQLNSIGHIDHPGTTVQVAGAVILRLLLITDSNSRILNRVFSNPEFYLIIINKVLVLINCIALYLLGLFIFKTTSDIYLSILLQLTPFISFQIFYGLVIVAPENFLILSATCINALIFYYIYSPRAENSLYKLSLVSGLICGFGIVSKLNFLPVCVIPLILLRGIKFKGFFILFTGIFFTIFFLPAISNINSFWSWVQKLIFNVGIHGLSNPAEFSILVFLNNIVIIFSGDLIFTGVYILIIISLLFVRNRGKIENIFVKERKALISIFAAMTLQVLIVAKNYLPYAQYYIIPSLMLTVSGLAISISILYKVYGKKLRIPQLRSVYIYTILILSVYGGIKIYLTYIEVSEFRVEAEKILNFVAQYSADEMVIPSIGAANKDCALAITTMYGYSGTSKPLYEKIISEKVTSKLYYDFWKNNLLTISGDGDILNILKDKSKIIVQLLSVTSIEKIIDLLRTNYNVNALDYKLLLRNGNGESVYEIRLK